MGALQQYLFLNVFSKRYNYDIFAVFCADYAKMDFDDSTIGAICEAPGCKQHDFLPFTCPLCRLVLCLEHRGVSSHACTPPAEHAADSSGSKRSSGFACFLCKDPLPCRIECGLCSNVVCLRHRDVDAHGCSAARDVARAAAPAAGGAGAGAVIAPLGGRSSVPIASGRPLDEKALALARKVALTKLKMRCPPAPKGVPPEELLYFETRCAPAGSACEVIGSSTGAVKPLCVFRGITVAQLLDTVAAAHGVINNNAAEPDPGKRLHLRFAAPVTGPAAAAAASAVPPPEAALQSFDSKLRDCSGLGSGDVLVLCRGR